MKKNMNEIRQMFLDFFKIKKHHLLPSSSLIPNEDNTLLFTNAGMNQFKNIFLGKEKILYNKVVTCQRCIRVGGKHNDFHNVGYSTQHHTFFEMLGNFSFGDYFKKEAIIYAWELLTNTKWFNISKNKLWVTVHYLDKKTLNIWKNHTDVLKNQIIIVNDIHNDISKSENFWTMGSLGPCGFCTEIFFKNTNSFFNKNSDSKLIKTINKEYIEIWNIVFIQFNKLQNNNLAPLPTLCVDTGMGLERITSVLQNVSSNYKIDIFSKLIKIVTNTCNFKKIKTESLYIICDHIRACIFLIYDGIIPSNNNRGYVLRRIIRRAIRHGNKLGINYPFLYTLVHPVINIIYKTYYELKTKISFIKKIIIIEEKKFLQTLENGLKILKKEFQYLKNNTLDGKIVFKLYDTFGFPPDLTEEICNENNINIMHDNFKIAMQKQRFNSQEKNRYIFNNKNILLNKNIRSTFNGYDNLSLKSKIIAIYIDNQEVNIINENNIGYIILQETPFYPESAGQIGDNGIIKSQDAEFIVYKTKKINNIIIHIGKTIYGTLKIKDNVCAIINEKSRKNISCNHSATHLLHASLIKILGKNVIQKGSLIKEKYFHFDFLYFQPLTKKQIYTIEKQVNKNIQKNYKIETKSLDINIAKKQGAIALFNEKYDKIVRMVKIKNISLELCSGTHVKQTGEIGIFKCLNESSVASGIRRIKAITNKFALENIQFQNTQIENIAYILRIDKKIIHEKIFSIMEDMNFLKKELKILKNYKIINEIQEAKKKIIKIKEVNLLIHTILNIDYKLLKLAIQKLKKDINIHIILLSTKIQNKIFLIIYVTESLIHKINAYKIFEKIKLQLESYGRGNTKIVQINIQYNKKNFYLLHKKIIPKIIIWIKNIFL